MKHRKGFTAVVAVVLLCSLASIAYADDDGHPWIKGLILWRLRDDLNDALTRITELEWTVQVQESQLQGLQEQIDEIMAMLEPEPGPEPGELTLAGTWVNPDYNESPDFSGKVVFIDNGDGTFTEDLYSTTTDAEPLLTTIVYVTDQYTDPSGNLITKWYADYFGTTAYILNMLHADNVVSESNFAYDDYPTEINPESTEYNIFYRQE
jgi:hypothetical protein